MYYLSKVNKELKFLSNPEIRLKILVDLGEGPKKVRDIARYSLLSYSSISSNMHRLSHEGFVEKIHNSFQLTNLGVIYISILMDFYDIISAVNDYSDFWLEHDINSLSVNDLNKLSSLEGSELIRCNSTDIYKTHKEFKRIFKDSKNLKVIFPYLHPEYPKLIRRLILKGINVELIVPKNILENFVKDIGKDVVKKGIEEGNFSMKYLDEHIKIALSVSHNFVSIGLFKIDGTYDQNRLLLSDKEKAINWGLAVFKSFDDYAVLFDFV
ncbi:helix-turn-helix transcriptional regulator [Methanobrevibacter olleyae]|uniref:Transcriptional regulator n=1 Tax=Methanobrevibacter olleyae TaxID=294671 RepID=A0A126QYD7_METOL|nr:transcriptional regulator FilR1 domain-containing protein [Methanobrevibacter olleyae]AMK14848.1 transcriptional regulator [Methanobrevibacter olleyae]